MLFNAELSAVEGFSPMSEGELRILPIYSFAVHVERALLCQVASFAELRAMA